MKGILAIPILAVLPAVVIVGAAEEKASGKGSAAEPKKQTHCPVMQRYEIDNSLYIDIKGYRIYTCCKGCINQIRANPDKYIKRLEDRGVMIEKAPLNGKNQEPR